MEEFYRKWLKLQEPKSNISSEPVVYEPTDIIYESPQLMLIVEKGIHKRQRVFRLDDHMYYFKIVPKGHTGMPLLSEMLDFLHSGFIHVLTELKRFYKPTDYNICYMTLFQKPMINGLNTGGIHLQSPSAATDLTDRTLSMLSQYLLSNQSLVLNNSFQVFFKILSIEHVKYLQNNQPR